jgi:phosphate ABC transporter, permease protein PstC
MSVPSVLATVCLIGMAAYFYARSRIRGIEAGSSVTLHSRPGYHGVHAFMAAVMPALGLLVVWTVASSILVDRAIRTDLPDSPAYASPERRDLAIGMIGSIARGLTLLDDEGRAAARAGIEAARPLLAARGVAVAAEADDAMVAAAFHANAIGEASALWRAVATLLVSVAGFAWTATQLRPRVRARNRVEGVVLAMLIVASSIAILTTAGIVLSMISETGRFFASVAPHEFFFGTVWDPRFAAAGATDSAGQFGLIPLLAGTLYIAFVAMLFAVPVGLFAAIYMAEYAGPRLRSVAKPLLEVLAGIPTIVYGFFAIVTVGPFLRDLSARIAGIATGEATGFIQAQSVLTAGVVMGIMLIPFVSSLSDDIITAVPRAMREGSLGLGATRSETVKRVILPAALPGIVGALLLTASRAIGETMIVVLAAGVVARLSLNPFEPMTTVTVKIVSQLTGDLEFDSPQTLVAFALGITLFAITLGLNVCALYVVRKYREQYE